MPRKQKKSLYKKAFSLLNKANKLLLDARLKHESKIGE